MHCCKSELLRRVKEEGWVVVLGFFFPGAVVIRGWKRRFVGAWCGGGGLRVDLWSFPKSNIDVGCGYKDTFCMIHSRGVVESGILLILYLR